MANKTKLGSIRKNVQGFDIREMIEGSKSTGKVGLYKGKKLAGGTMEAIFKANDRGIADATCKAITMAENSRKKNKKAKDHLRKENPVRVKNVSKKEAGTKAYLERMRIRRQLKR